MAYNDYHNSWANTQFGSREATTFAYIWAKATGQMPLTTTVSYHMNLMRQAALPNFTASLKGGYQGWLTMDQVAVAIGIGGIRRFIQFIQDPDYGPSFFLNSITGTVTANSSNTSIPGPIRFGMQAASWGHTFFPNDELRHIIASFLITERYDPSIAVAVTSSNEYLGFIQNDIPDLWRGIDNGWAFQASDLAHNKQGMVLWQYYDWWRNGYIDKIFKDK
jgi:hypothetical protein